MNGAQESVVADGNQLGAMLDRLSDGVVAFGADGHITAWNRGAEALLGGCREERLGTSIMEVFPNALDDLKAFCGKPMERLARGLDADLNVEVVVDTLEHGGFIAVLRDLGVRRQSAREVFDAAAAERRFAELLVNLARLGSVELDDFERALTELLADGLGADRVSIWRLGERAIHCEDLFTRVDRQHASGAILTEAMFPAYFEALGRDECIVADDALTHPATACFREVYLEPLGILSMLDSPLRTLEQGVRGVICVESLVSRRWAREEVRFCEEAASLLVQANERDWIRRLERRHATVLASIGEAVIACDTRGIVTLLNPVAQAMLGRQGTSMVGSSIFELFTPHADETDEPLLTLDMLSVPAATSQVERRAVLRGCEGVERPVVFSMAPIAEAGELLGAVLTFRDISAEERAQREIELKNRRLESIGQALPDLLFAVSVDGRVEYAQHQARPDLLRPPEELKESNLADLFEPELAMRLLDAVRSAVEDDEVRQVDYELDLPMGRQTFEARMARLSDLEATVIVRNVTEERKRQSALEEERSRLEAVLASTSAIIYVARLPDFTIEYVSDSAMNVLGFTVAEMSAQGFWESAVHPDDRARILADLDELYTSGRHIHEYRHRHKDGGYRWLRDDVRLVRDVDGRPIRAVGASFDITERKVSELRLDTLLALKKLVSRASKGFLEAHGVVPDATLLETLQGVGEHSRADRAYVFRFHDGLLTNTHEWCAPGVEPRIGRLQGLPQSRYTFYLDPIRSGQSLWIPSVRDLPLEEEGVRNLLLARGIECILAVPLMSDGQVHGLVGLDNPNIEPMEPQEFAGLIQLFADTVAAGLRRASDEVALRTLNEMLTAKGEQQRALLALSNSLAMVTERVEITEIIRRHMRQMLRTDRLSLLEVSEDGESVRLDFVDQSADIADGDMRFVNSRESTVVLSREQMVSTAPMACIERGALISSLEYPVEDFPDWVHFRDVQGLQQFAVVPMRGARGVVGTLNIGLMRSSPPISDEIAAAEQLATTLAAHLTILRGREALRGLNAELEERVEARTRELRDSELRFERLFLDAPQAMIIVDDGGQVVQSNHNARRLFGYDGDAFLGLPVSALVPVALRSAHDSQIAAFHRDRRPTAMASDRIVHAVRRDGSVFSSEIGLVPLQLAQGTQVLAGITDISERLAAEAAVTESLREKETLLKEIHHRVKNNLQIISSLLMLQSDQMPSELGRKLLEESVFRVRSMALIHEQLYGVESLQFIDFGDYARMLANSLRATLAPTAAIEVVSEVVEVTVELAVPLGLILNELLTNAFKYGLDAPVGLFGGPRRIEADVRIEVSVEDGRIRLAVIDAGPGLPTDFDPRTSSTLGLQLIRSLNRQIRGELLFDVEHGTRFMVRCPRE